MNNKNKKIWDKPWGITESCIIVTAFIISGFMIDFFSDGNTVVKVSYPLNIIILCSFFFILTIIYFILKKSYIVKWLQSVSLSVVSVAWLLILVLLAGIFNQEVSSKKNLITNLNINNIFQSSAFIILQIILLINLWFAILKRFIGASLRDIGFILNHFGILILIISLSFGSGDIIKYTLKVSKTNYTWKTSEKKSNKELPFAFELLNFKLDNFPAKIGIIDNATDEVLTGNDKILQTDTDTVIRFEKNKIKLLKYYKNAVKFGEKFHPVNEQGSCPAAYVEIEDKKGNKREAWISCGSYLYPSIFFPVDSFYTLALLEPEPKKYESEIAVYFKDGSVNEYKIQVNNPANIEGWDIYLTDYDQKTGEWSDYVIIEMVKDPWLKAVYLGIILMAAGAVTLIFTGKKYDNSLA